MGIYSKPRLTDKGRQAYERERKRSPFLPPLLSTAGKVEVTDKVRVVLPTPGGKATVVAYPVGGWRFAVEYYDHLPAALAEFEAAKAAVVTPVVLAVTVDQAKSDTDALRDDLKALRDLTVDFERRVDAFAAKHRLPDNNVVHFSNIAAE